ncbi:MAG: SWIM zinc finger family protein [Acidobacteriota bacterium]
MASLGLANRLERGRRYAHSGRVLQVEIGPGRVEAHVQGSRYEPYRVRFALKRFTRRQWEKAIEALASQALFAAKLLAGEMPRNIEEAFDGLGLPLFPSSPRSLTTECSCPDLANPCKHVAAVHHVLADRFDEDPVLLFRLRGRDREQILKELRTRRAAKAAGRPAVRSKTPLLAGSVARFWSTGEGFETVPVSVGPPAVSSALMKRLGVPLFWKPHPEIRGAMERLYAKVTERAMAIAYGSHGSEPPEG